MPLYNDSHAESEQRCQQKNFLSPLSPLLLRSDRDTWFGSLLQLGSHSFQLCCKLNFFSFTFAQAFSPRGCWDVESHTTVEKRRAGTAGFGLLTSQLPSGLCSLTWAWVMGRSWPRTKPGHRTGRCSSPFAGITPSTAPSHRQDAAFPTSM
jgi:hypothetical protein